MWPLKFSEPCPCRSAQRLLRSLLFSQSLERCLASSRLPQDTCQMNVRLSLQGPCQPCWSKARHGWWTGVPSKACDLRVSLSCHEADGSVTGRGGDELLRSLLRFRVQASTELPRQPLVPSGSSSAGHPRPAVSGPVPSQQLVSTGVTRPGPLCPRQDSAACSRTLHQAGQDFARSSSGSKGFPDIPASSPSKALPTANPWHPKPTSARTLSGTLTAKASPQCAFINHLLYKEHPAGSWGLGPIHLRMNRSSHPPWELVGKTGPKPPLPHSSMGSNIHRLVELSSLGSIW